MKNVIVAEASGAVLDYMVAKCEKVPWDNNTPNYSFDPAHAYPIIDRENISTIRLDDESIPDAAGYHQNVYEPRWAAIAGDRYSLEQQYSSQGDDWGYAYAISANAVIGPTSLVAAMRCHVDNKLGHVVEVPAELL